MLLQIDKVQIAFGSHQLLDNASFSINEGDRIGLIGRNGLGKTSLFRVITGQMEASAGQVISYKHCRSNYMRQELDWKPEVTVESILLDNFTNLQDLESEIRRLETRLAEDPNDEAALKSYGEAQQKFEQAGGYEMESRIDAVLAGLGLPSDARKRTIGQLSGGQINRLALAGVILSGANLLFLDEPTNHLDIEAIEWLEKYLLAFDGAFLIISHDRTFLNRTVNRIIELEAERLEIYPGNYDFYRLDRLDRRAKQNKMYDKQRTEIDRLEDFVKRNIAGQNTKQAQARRRALKKLDHVSRPPSEIGVMKFVLQPSVRAPQIVAEMRNVSFAHPNHPPLFENLNMEIHRGQKIGFIGPNGTGKTTLLRILRSETPPITGEVMVGEKVEFAYFDQHMEHLDRNRPVIEVAWDSDPERNRGGIMSALGAFQFSGDFITTKVRNLSGGEKARLAFLKLSLERPNFLMLDEPTNHLDIPTRETFEETLADYEGTLIIISHDRYFLDEVADVIWRLDDGVLKAYPGNYSEFEERRERELAQQAAEIKPAEKPAGKLNKGRPNTNDAKKRQRLQQKLEREIDELETRMTALDGRMADPARANDWEKLHEWADEKRGLEKRVEALMSDWEMLGEQSK